MAMEIYPSVYTVAELIKAATVTCAAGEITRLGEYKVQAGEMVSIGSGMLAGMDNATGRVFMVFKDSASAVINGKVRLSAFSAQNRNLETLKEYRTEQLNTSETDLTKQLPLAEHSVWLREDQRLVLEFIADATATIDKTKSKIMLPVTVQAL